MSNNEQLFAEIIPSEEASLSGGGGYGRRGDRPGVARRPIEVNASASATIIGDPEISTVTTFTDVYADDRRVIARASSIARGILI
ncbi:MAG: hypothetical protein AB4206_01135 [Xenococcaceae cyanobacterium]